MTSNSVTLEQLNAPTDQELESLRCAGSKVSVNLAWQDKCGAGLASGVLDAKRVGQWIEELDRTFPTAHEASRSEPHEDEELMLRIPLDEGV